MKRFGGNAIRGWLTIAWRNGQPAIEPFNATKHYCQYSSVSAFSFQLNKWCHNALQSYATKRNRIKLIFLV